MTDILDILRRAQAGDSIRRTARATGMDRKTIGNYLRLATEQGFVAGMADEQLAEIAAAVFRAVHGPQMKSPSVASASAPLIQHRELISDWLEKDGLTLTKTHIKLGHMGVAVSYSSLYRYARDEFGFGGPKVTVRMAETEPGEVAQVDIDSFFGLFVDNLLQLMLIAVLCVNVCGMPAGLVFGGILPGAALSILFGNLFYAWQAGLFACLISALLECVGAFLGDWLRSHTPRAALLSSLAGIAITFISMGFVFQIFAMPAVAVVPALIDGAPKFGGDLYIYGIISLSQGFMLSCMVLSAMMVFVVEREFLKAALWMAAAAILSFFGVIHAYTLTPAGVQNRFGFGAANEFSAAYLIASLILVVLHYYNRGRESVRTGIVA